MGVLVAEDLQRIELVGRDAAKTAVEQRGDGAAVDCQDLSWLNNLVCKIEQILFWQDRHIVWLDVFAEGR
jgi:hypothetical protein